MTPKRITFLIVLLYNLYPLIGQVTIGMHEKPSPGSLLQLKDGTVGNNIFVNSSKGLALPRVELLTLQLDDKASNLSQTIKGATGDWDQTSHIGLLVYNVSKKFCSPQKGLYVWNGTKWELLESQDKIREDVRSITDNGTQITISYKDESTSYYYADFGSAGTWMTQNLATRYQAAGTLIERKQVSSYEVPYCFSNSSDISEGLLYNWNAAMNGQVCTDLNQGQDLGNEVEQVNKGYIQGICPQG